DQSLTSATRGDGGVYSSACDWARWETAMSENLILSQEFQEMAFTPGKLNNGTLIEYGFGWMLNSFQGVIHQYHTGSTIGFRTAVERFPEKGLSVLVLVNRANASPWTIARNIAEHFF
ncbi:MAG: serine hydrolase, partial [Deltaproteobacteria bacterium]